ncbi:MAG: SUMF1/EgtB/PvdO family nonheme iron enzyme [Verrucomicrobiota bacterium]
MKPMAAVAALGLAFGAITTGDLHAATVFGSGANTFTIDFVEVGNAGNANDAGAGGGSYSSPYGGVNYNYRIGTHEISQEMITRATASGLANVTAGAHTGNEPAANISWYEAAAFVNWLNTSTGHQAAYNLIFSGGWSMTLWGASDQASTGVDGGTNPYRHKDAFYFLPSEDEWYKAAYHQNDGVTANYWDYALGSNTIPTAFASGTGAGTAVYNQSFATGPADITLAGGLSPYGTMGQNGNVWEWNESAFDGTNNASFEDRAVRGGVWDLPEVNLRSSNRDFLGSPASEFVDVGFRVASVPEPSAALMMMMGLGALCLRRRSRPSL